MARTPRAPAPAEAAPAEPDLLDNAPPPREAEHLVGHDSTMAQLADAFAASPPQAILLEGPRGIGKATLAFRLARALLAEPDRLARDLASEPASRTAAQIAAGTHPSLLHLTRPYDEKAKRFKSELTVDVVRRIVPFLGATAAGNAWRVVIVDAVDDMNLNAANALLKSLEEPPRRALFVLIAHIPGRVLPTIRSRCRALRLRPLGVADVAAALAALGADPSLAAAGEGSVRRALGLAATGADAVREARRLLQPAALADVRQHHALAELAAQRRDERFAVIVDLIFDALAARARDGSGRLPTAALDAYAGAYLEAAAERRAVEIYNLDQREYVLALCARIAAADRAAAGAP